MARTVTVAERRARLGRRHHLAPGAPDAPVAGGRGGGPPTAVETVVDDVVALHATDPATVYLSVHARSAGATVESVDEALFDRKTLLRTLAMRRTLFVPTVAGARMIEASSSVGVATTERKRLVGFLGDSGIARPQRWLDELFGRIDRALDGATEGLTARELGAAVPELTTRIMMGAGTRHPVEAPATSRVLGLMAVEGRLVRGRPTGDWTSRLYRWHRRDRWWPPGTGPAPDSLGETEASAQLVRAWLGRFGPATVDDLKWWTGWTMGKTRKALAAVDTVEVALEGGPAGTGDPLGEVGEVGLVLADDAEPVDAPEPWAALLPSLDPTPMGWKHRHWYLGDLRAELFDRNGNIGPTVWVDGRIVGGWAQRPGGEVVVELLTDVGADHRALIDRRVEALAGFVGPVVVKPSFPTPLQRRLSS